MTTIHVLFPKNGPPLVMSDPEAVVTGRPFTWAIMSENPRIARVGIEFPGGEAYFSDPKSKSVQERVLLNGVASIWGAAPPIGRKDVVRPTKYTLFGRDASGERLPEVELDPQILPTDPR